MFTQFFGNFLLNEKLVASWQLAEALENIKDTKLKLGVLGINAGLMTAEEVNRVHELQQTEDKRFGEIAVDQGYLTVEQVSQLLSSQKTGHLLLGQALVDKGYMTNVQFEAALNSYKNKYSLTNEDFTTRQNEKVDSIIKSFYKFNSFKYAKIFTEYVSLTFKNIIRFIGDDFTPLTPDYATSVKADYAAVQVVNGKYNFFTAIEGESSAVIKFASRFASEDFDKIDEYTLGSLSEFLNLNNGLFTVNVSNQKQVELQLEPQSVVDNKTISASSEIYCIPIMFGTDKINIILSLDIPVIE